MKSALSLIVASLQIIFSTAVLQILAILFCHSEGHCEFHFIFPICNYSESVDSCLSSLISFNIASLWPSFLLFSSLYCVFSLYLLVSFPCILPLYLSIIQVISSDSMWFYSISLQQFYISYLTHLLCYPFIVICFPDVFTEYFYLPLIFTPFFFYYFIGVSAYLFCTLYLRIPISGIFFHSQFNSCSPPSPSSPALCFSFSYILLFFPLLIIIKEEYLLEISEACILVALLQKGFVFICSLVW